MNPVHPTAREDTVGLWFCPNDGLDQPTSALLAPHWLDEHERETAGRFLFERDRRQYLVAHCLVRRVLSLETGIPEAEAVLWRSSRGRPFLQAPPGGLPDGARDLDFNLSHAHGFNVMAVARDRRVGVDIERLDRGGERGFDWVVESFAPQERAYLAGLTAGGRRDRATLRLWTLKEAYAKARGLGLGLPFDSFSFELDEEQGVVGFRPPEGDDADRWCFVELNPRPQVLVSLAVERSRDGSAPGRIEMHDGFPWGRAVPRDIPLPAPHRALAPLVGAGA
ncbi:MULTISPECIES: 4'-phosphopantetheinyl transferase family protein [Streptomyces]|uniref:4'-phosphopantetheinyl transferase superfamily protein n=1 Tax=Streptomyces xanthii TaxID=2768069 RepID=A0A7H1BKH4_9ACTN|nr:4'-phosphopantetheinyl transferase superfamily protein [Streptomyces xanthii]QNS09229.1 4'-phosphopantetheinyl transferase superfamily protein [Streptomyces xanthii]